MVSNPATVIESGYRLMNNVQVIASHMMTAFRGLVGEQRPIPNNPDAERLASHFSNVIVNQKVEIVGEPGAERLVVVRQQGQSFWETLPPKD